MKCKICGREFTPNHPRMLTCSEECSQKNTVLVKRAANRRARQREKETKNTWYRRHHPLEPRVCMSCGKTFMPHDARQRYCTPGCSKTAAKKRAKVIVSVPKIVICKVCGKEFESIRGTAKYCSNKCFRRAAKIRIAERMKNMSAEERERRRLAKNERARNRCPEVRKGRFEDSLIGLSRTTLDDIFDEILNGV